MSSIVLRAMGKTITKAVSIAEILKKRFPLHQITEIGSTEIEEIYQPTIEGLDEYIFCSLLLFFHR
jgi:DNA-binding protein